MDADWTSANGRLANRRSWLAGVLPDRRLLGLQFVRTLVSLILAALLAIAASQTPSAAPEELTASPILVQPIAPIRPVLGADNRSHLVYELLLVNQSSFVVTIDSIAVLDGASGGVLKELTGDALPMVLRLSLFGGRGTTLEPSQSAFVFVDAAVESDAPLPASVRHKIATTQTMPAIEGTADLGGLTIEPGAGMTPKVTFVTALMPVDATPAVVLMPPVRGGNWVMFRGCCDLASSHRGGTGSYGGTTYVAERFAVDFVRIDGDDRLITGPGNELTSYRQYGERVYAVADAMVISARNSVPDTVPGSLPDGIGADDAGGNSVVLDTGGGVFAFYAHMQPGSVRVKAGDRVKSGDVIGLIGNSGKTVGPHLHFHVMDRASPLAADGLPYVFSSFVGQGVLGSDALMLAFQGQPAPVDRGMLTGAHTNQHPLNNQVVDFGQ